jgi:hypothetical protein
VRCRYGLRLASLAKVVLEFLGRALIRLCIRLLPFETICRRMEDQHRSEQLDLGDIAPFDEFARGTCHHVGCHGSAKSSWCLKDARTKLWTPLRRIISSPEVPLSSSQSFTVLFRSKVISLHRLSLQSASRRIVSGQFCPGRVRRKDRSSFRWGDLLGFWTRRAFPASALFPLTGDSSTIPAQVHSDETKILRWS